VIRQVHLGFDGTPIYEDTVFDGRGYVVRRYEPRFSNDPNLHFTLIDYDGLGRPVLANKASGGSVSYAYTALDQLVTETVVGRSNTEHTHWQRLHGTG